jgi:hypothetical protein
MALAPGAVDAANGSNTAVRFFATGSDDVNYRVDGVDYSIGTRTCESTPSVDVRGPYRIPRE